MSDTAQSSRPGERAGVEAGAPAEKPARRSDATRAAILAAARERFAASGYERATIRAIAQDAGIDPSMVMRYYGNKEGLFAAAAEIDLRMPDVSWPDERESALPVGSGHGAGGQAGLALVEHFLDLWENSEILTALLRVGVTNASGAERMREIFEQQLIPVAVKHSPDPQSAPRRAALVASQILGMALARYVLRFPPAVEMSRQEVIDWLGPTVHRYLTSPDA
ncbi:TetR/AcrR family transcriptional regulator [Streptomyces cavernicola]|uniref:TetR family transcriptional regulator n=1 Tax=Streptomyces cavernicola TaxID=3043613 RepID=A0ABT6SKZ5_9ACTN|nr:TetR family transcriptional regulator [Streptomyces sp. B-S-A6]MDI3408861.1 TetR family transcriptional regulator [Streptomyces sp. B-S-A6]